MKVDMFDGVLRWTEPEDTVVVEIDGYECRVTGLEIDEESGKFIIKAEYEELGEFVPSDKDDDEEPSDDLLESCAQEGGVCSLPENIVTVDYTPQAKEA